MTGTYHSFFQPKAKDEVAPGHAPHSPQIPDSFPLLLPSLHLLIPQCPELFQMAPPSRRMSGFTLGTPCHSLMDVGVGRTYAEFTCLQSEFILGKTDGKTFRGFWEITGLGLVSQSGVKGQ